MSVDAKRLNTDAEFAAQYFSQFGDVNAAQRALSEAGATEANLFEITLTLAKGYQEKSGVGTPEADQAILDNEETPGSQRDAIERGVELQKKADEESAKKSDEEKKKVEEQKAEANKPATSNQPTDSSGIQL